MHRVALVTSTVDATAQEASAEAAQALGQLLADPRLCVSGTGLGSSLPALAGQGYDLVIAVGPGFSGPAIEVAKARPKTGVAVLDATLPSAPNLIGVGFREDQAVFLAGAAAALASQTHIVTGIYGPAGDAGSRRLRTAFEGGALHAQPQTLVRGISQPPGPAFATTQWSSEVALAQVGGGADVIFGSPGTPSQGALVAVAGLNRTPAGGPVACIGVEVDEYYSFPAARSCLLTSAEKRFGVALRATVAAYLKGRWPAGGLTMDVRGGGVGVAPPHELADRLGAAQRASLEATRRGLADGSIGTGVG